jgi:UDP-3-O-[3-hydroxymyristoyl] N-acetylglucosamine deacetylase
MLDAVGDLYLAGLPILGAYTAFKSGHALNNVLLRAALEHGASEIVSDASMIEAPVFLWPMAQTSVSVVQIPKCVIRDCSLTKKNL